MIEYSVRPVVCDYGVYKNNELIVICNSKYNADLIAKILDFDDSVGFPICMEIIDFVKSGVEK